MGCSNSSETNKNKEPQVHPSHDKEGSIVVKPTAKVELKENKEDPPMIKLLKDPMPDFSTIDSKAALALWLKWNENLIHLIINMKHFKKDFISLVKFFHSVVTKVLQDEDKFTDKIREMLCTYITAIWSQDHERFETAYNNFEDLLGFEGIEKARNLTELHEIFTSSQGGILSDLQNGGVFTNDSKPSLADFEELIKLVLEHIQLVIQSSSPDNEKQSYFRKLKGSLTSFKLYSAKNEKENLINEYYKLRVLIGVWFIYTTGDLLKLKEFLQKDEKFIVNRFIHITEPSEPTVAADKVVNFCKQISVILIANTPFYSETLDLIRIFYDAAFRRDIEAFLFCLSEVTKISNAIDEIINDKVKIDFTTIQKKEDLILAWRRFEKALLYKESLIQGIHRKEIRELHDYIYYTFEGNISSFFKLKDALNQYYKAVKTLKLSEQQREMKDLCELCKKENIAEDHNLKKGMENKPNMLQVVDSSLLSAWMNFVNNPFVKQTVDMKECPITYIKQKLLLKQVEKACHSKRTDFEWYKQILQDYVDSIWARDFAKVDEYYHDIKNYGTRK